MSQSTEPEDQECLGSKVCHYCSHYASAIQTLSLHPVDRVMNVSEGSHYLKACMLLIYVMQLSQFHAVAIH